MSSFTYNAAKTSLGKGEIDWVNDGIEIDLVSDAYTPNQDSHQFESDLTGVVATVALSSKTATQDNTNDRAVFDAADVQFTGITGTFRYGVVRQSDNAASANRLIRLLNLEGANVTLSNGTYDITWSAGGVFNIQGT